MALVPKGPRTHLEFRGNSDSHVKKRTASRIAWTLLGVFLLFGIVAALLRGRRGVEESPSTQADEPGPALDSGTWAAPAATAEAGAHAGENGAAIPDIQNEIALRSLACVAALESGDAAAYVENFTEDALSLPVDGPVVHGRAALRNAVGAAMRRMRFLSAQTTPLDTRFNGRMVYETGRYEFVVEQTESFLRQTLAGRYVIVWKRIGDEWKIALNAAQPWAP